MVWACRRGQMHKLHRDGDGGVVDGTPPFGRVGRDSFSPSCHLAPKEQENVSHMCILQEISDTFPPHLQKTEGWRRDPPLVVRKTPSSPSTPSKGVPVPAAGAHRHKKIGRGSGQAPAQRDEFSKIWLFSIFAEAKYHPAKKNLAARI